MSRVDPYASIQKRTLQAALMHLLETEYRMIGSRRILKVLVEDIDALVEDFYPKAERVNTGQLIWTCTGDEGGKAQPGKATEEYKTVTVALPLIAEEEIQERMERCGRGNGKARQQARYKRQVKRMVEAAYEQGGLLTIAELSVILGVTYETVQRCIREIEAEDNRPLPLKGYKMDQGSRPTHKGDIVRLYEQGMEPPDIAHETRHSLKSVDRYLKDYERVRMLLKENLSVEAISAIIGRGKSVVQEYVTLAQTYHPELFQDKG